MDKYLENSEYIDWRHLAVTVKAAELSDGCTAVETVAKRCFEFVRDTIKHSWDYRQGPVTCRASEVLLHGTGYCYAKSHLLAALLRANGIPTGLCYQRLSVETGGQRNCLHGLNAVYLEQYGWYRLDARGNKAEVAAEFCPPTEKLAFSVIQASESDLPEIWSVPLPVVITALTQHQTVEQVFEHLPDVELIKTIYCRSWSSLNQSTP
ncbi:MAG: transglutaminase family protein [Deltaproteobacteria bacterium]|nr:transglutaminase family protein [Deltaproteobacteria bacterium]